MSATIKTLPNWKRDSTPGDWLGEVAALAYENPARFARIVVCYELVDEKKHATEHRFQSYGIETNEEIVGALEVAKLEVYEYMKGRRS